MERIFTRSLFLAFTFCCFILTDAFAQTVILGAIDPGPYGQGSTIAVPFHLNTSISCASSTNVFNLYLSDAAGNFGAPQLIGSYAGFYGTFVNGVIPTGTTASALYRIRVQCTDPAIAPVTSGPFTVTALDGIAAGASSQTLNSTSPEVYGNCIGTDNTAFPFVNTSSATATDVKATFFNELSQTGEGTIALPGPSFTARAANYTVLVRAANAGGTVVGTKAYALINNVVNNGLITSGSTSDCLQNGSVSRSYSIDITSLQGIQQNFPGLIYNVTWGDGSSSNYTLCDIVNASGKISHVYTKSSCGNVANGEANVFQINFLPTSPYCPGLVRPLSAYTSIVQPPKNKITLPITGCTNTPINLVNNSIPGQDPNSKSFDCSNLNALYTWVVDGTVVAVNLKLSDPLAYTFTTPGNHFVGLHLQNGNALCVVPDDIQSICIQDPPKPSFTLSNPVICTSGPVQPVNTSIVDENCNANTTYAWVVTGPAQPGFLNGTTANSKTPRFDFNVSGVYTIQLNITTASCGSVSSEPQEVVINLNPVAKLSADAIICGKDQVISFSPTATTTKTTLSGTAKTLPTTYTWTVSGGAYTFANGTTANSQYPDIIFSEYNAYTITVSHANNCNVASDSQVLSFQESPIVNAGGDRTICEGNSTLLDASITGIYTGLTWIGGTGTFSPGRNVLKPTYTPSAAEIAAGTANISLQVTTNLGAPCDIITNPVIITITRKDDITSVGTGNVCTGSNFNYTITSQNPLSTYNWTAAVSSGSATGFTASGSGNTINDVITNTGAGDAVVKYTITPITNGCPGNSTDLLVTINRIPILTFTQPAAPICSSEGTGVVLNSTQLNTTYTWTSTAGTDITGSTQQTTPVSATTITDLLVNTGSVYESVNYVVTPYHGACAGQPVTITVIIAPAPIPSKAGPDESICNGPTYTLKGNNPSPGTGKWSIASGQTGITFSDATNPNAVVSGLLPGNVYQFVWSITTAPGCTPTTSTVNITTDVPTIAGTVTGSATVCEDANSGFLNLTGNNGSVLSWESSTDGTNWVNLANITTQQEYLNLTQTTFYRAVVQNGTCEVVRSAIGTITVNQPPITSNAGTPQQLCNAATTTLAGNDPSPFAGVWTQTAGPPATIVNPSDPKSQVNGLVGNNLYTFRWTIKGVAPCADNSSDVTITNAPDVIANFTMDRNVGCGPLPVQLTNTSSLIAGTTFLWDFGDGTGNSNEINPQHTFQPRNDGRDITYTVTLSIVNNCVARAPVSMDVIVRPLTPIARILPDKLSACGSLAVKVQNISPGNNDHYDYYLYDGGTLVQSILNVRDKSDVTFNAVTPAKAKTYTLYMIATDMCGTAAESIRIPITVTPPTFLAQAFAKNNNRKGCAPFSAVFVNNSSGGDTFKYRITDANGNIVDEIQGTATETPYVFTTAGTFFVKVIATNDCASITATDAIEFDVAPIPVPNFSADITSGCKAIKVTFTNTTPASGGTPAQSLSYDWDFGDGSVHYPGFTPLPHLYKAAVSPYTVTLTVTNLATGCSSVITKTNYINVNGAPNVDFDVSPGFITKIPNYHFAFDDKTSGNPVSWKWDFGDNSTSTEQNPGHTYADTGIYKVTLLVVNRDGCDSAVTHKVQITGIPGQLYIPNAFMPASSTSELRTFVIKGSGILNWHMQIFNNWGQLVWETTKLNDKGEPVDSWDGLYKGVPAQQGVYIWQASASFINGTEWKGMQYGPNSLPKRTGVIHLIR